MKSIFTCYFLIATAFVFAQPVLTEENNAPHIGESFSFNVGSYVTPPAGGANVTWDFSTQTSLATGTFTYSDVAQSPYASTMLTGEILETCDICASQNVITTASGSRGVVGFIYPSANFAMYFWGGRVDFPYPLNYLDSETNWTYNGQTTVSGVPLLFEGSVDMEADGYGTLVLPWGSIPNVIRVHRVIFEERFNSGQAGYVELEYYEYYTPGISFPLIRQYQERNVTSTGAFIDIAQEYLMWLNPQSTGCTNPNSCNYNALAATDDGSCIIIGSPCDDGLAETVNDVIASDCMCAGEVVVAAGCTMPDACNFDATATIDDGSCYFVSDPCDDGNPSTIADMYNADCICEGIVASINGCTDPSACNFVPEATAEDGSCLFVGSPCDDGTAETINDVIDLDCMCVGEFGVVVGCMMPDACNYNMEAMVDDGSCVFIGDPCDDGNPESTGDIYNANCQCEGLVSIMETATNSLVYPNPATTDIHVTINNTAPDFVEIYDMRGARLMAVNKTHTVSVATLTPGIYTLKMTLGNEIVIRRLEVIR